MKFVLITKDTGLVDEARKGFHPEDELEAFEEWEKGLDACAGADLLFVELVATLDTPHKISGYEKFGEAKRSHETAAPIPLALVSPEDDYELDFMVGWPNFVFANVRQPVTYKIFRRASTWI